MRISTAFALLGSIWCTAFAAPHVEQVVVSDAGGFHWSVASLVISQNGDLGGTLQADVGSAKARYYLEIRCRQRMENGNRRGTLLSMRIGQTELKPAGLPIFEHDTFRSYETSRFDCSRELLEEFIRSNESPRLIWESDAHEIAVSSEQCAAVLARADSFDEERQRSLGSAALADEIHARNETAFSRSAQNRRDRASYISAHPQLSKELKDLISKSIIKIGMSKEELTAAWGPPDTKTILNDGEEEIWSYNNGLAASVNIQRGVVGDIKVL